MQQIEKNTHFPTAVKIAQATNNNNGTALIVGGSVRDAIIHNTPKAYDIDIELFGITENNVENILKTAGLKFKKVGRAFPVWKTWEPNKPESEAIDIALPRTETTTGQNHTDFTFNVEPTLSFEEASKRRDFTMNAIAYNPITKEIVDPHNGIHDIQNKILKHTSPKFAEDHLRVLRGAQFCARFNLTPHPQTILLCRTLTPKHLSKERIFEEFKKLIIAKKPSAGLQFLKTVQWDRFFPELKALQDIPQDPKNHPEGDVWNHTCHCLDAFARNKPKDPNEALILGFAILCHDFGKPITTDITNNNITSYGHEEAGVTPARNFMRRISDNTELIEAVANLTQYHMHTRLIYQEFKNGGNPTKALNRLALKSNIQRLAYLAWYDTAGRPPRKPNNEVFKWTLKQAKRLKITKNPPKPLLLGRHLLQLGYTPGTFMGIVLKTIYKRQIENEITTSEQAIQFALNQLQSTKINTKIEKIETPCL